MLLLALFAATACTEDTGAHAGLQDSVPVTDSALQGPAAVPTDVAAEDIKDAKNAKVTTTDAADVAAVVTTPNSASTTYTGETSHVQHVQLINPFRALQA